MSTIPVLPAVLAEKAFIELNEIPADYDFYLNGLREWLALQTHFTSPITDEFLLPFLRVSKFSLEKTKQRIENYFKYRASIPELFAERHINDPRFEFVIRSGSIVLLPEPISPDGPRVIMFLVRNYDMTKHKINDLPRALLMFGDLFLYQDPNISVSGLVMVMDLANTSRDVILDFNPLLARRYVEAVNNSVFPARFKGIHFINTMPIFEKLYRMIQGAINPKIKDRFYVHGTNLDTLYEHIPQRILPKEHYGGDYELQSMKDEVLAKVNATKDRLSEIDSYGLTGDAPQWVGSQNECNYGADGSFRKLNID